MLRLSRSAFTFRYDYGVTFHFHEIPIHNQQELFVPPLHLNPAHHLDYTIKTLRSYKPPTVLQVVEMVGTDWLVRLGEKGRGRPLRHSRA